MTVRKDRREKFVFSPTRSHFRYGKCKKKELEPTEKFYESVEKHLPTRCVVFKCLPEYILEIEGRQNSLENENSLLSILSNEYYSIKAVMKRASDNNRKITLSDFGLAQADISKAAGSFKSFAEEIKEISHKCQNGKTKATVIQIFIAILLFGIPLYIHPWFAVLLFFVGLFFAGGYTEEQPTPLEPFNGTTEMMSRLAEIESQLSIIEKIEKYEDMLIANTVRGLFKDKEYIDNLSGLDFEKEMARTFTALGMHATVTSASNDKGIDIFLRVGAKKIAVQCKNQSTKMSPAAARDLLGAMTSENCDESLLISTGGFTSNTMDFCRKNSIKTMDINDVVELRDKLFKEGKLKLFTTS